MDRGVLLQKLPPFSNRIVTIRKNQTVKDIVNEVLAAHEAFAQDYDLIANDFNRSSNLDTAKALFAFLKKNVRYKIESESRQTTKSPAAILVTATGDCKHYASFIGGVLDALKRQGKNIDWNYRFASYNWFDSEPGHVFVVLNEGGKEIWIDPVLKTFNERLEPTYILDKRPKNNYMLSRVSGLGLIEQDSFQPVSAENLSLLRSIADMPVQEIYEVAMSNGDESVPPEMTKNISVLVKYGVMDGEGRVNDGILKLLSNSLGADEWEAVANARIAIHTAAIGGFFGDLWSATKKVTLAIPRGAYLSLVALNVFALGTKLGKILYKPDGSYDWENEKKLADKWRSLGGAWGNFKSAIQTGMKKPAIIGVAPAAAAWALTASVIITALTPLITNLLKQRSQELPNEYPYGVCADGFTPRNADGSCPNVNNGNNNGGGGGGVMDFIQQNPLLVVGVGAAAAYFLTKKD